MKKLILALLILPFLAPAQEVDFSKLAPMTVTSVFDGDGFKGFWKDSTRGEIRLLGVDTPEKIGFSTKAQPYGNAAGDSLRALVKGKVVDLDTITIKGANQRDVFGRLIAVAYLKDTTNVNFHIVDRGWGWAVSYPNLRHPQITYVLKVAQRKAREANRGLWEGGGQRTPTWWRKTYSIFR